MALNPLLKKLVSQSNAKYKSGGISKLAKLKEGRNVIRPIVPAPGEVSWVGSDARFFRDLGVHWIKSDINAKPIAVVGSEEICYQRVSPLAAAIDMAIANAYDEESKTLYTSWKAKPSVILNVVNRDAGDEVQVLELTPTTFGKIMGLAELWGDNDVDIFDHATGMDIVITKTGKGLNTTYDVAAVPLAPGKTFKPVTAEQVRAAEDLDKFIEANYFRGEEQKALNAVAQIAGITIPQIGHTPSTPVAALTSTAASVAPAAPAVAAAAPAVAAAAVAMTPEQMQAEIQRQAMAMMQQMAAQKAAAAPVQTTVAPAQVITPETSISDLGADEQDALLAELNAIGT